MLSTRLSVCGVRNGDLQAKEELRWWDYVPILNICVDAFASEPPPVEQLAQVLSTVSITAALILSVAASFVTGVTFEELQDAAARHSNENENELDLKRH